MKCVDLFCGCGGLTQGFQNAGIEVIAAFDNWSEAVTCYRQNFNHPVIKENLSDVKTVSAKIAEIAPDIVIGGPPCQDFSSAGKREEKDRADLTVCFAQIIRAVRPQWFVMENVERAQNSAAYQRARKIFASSGYGLTEEVMNACYYGVPQSRRRFICIGLLGAKDGFLSDDILMGKHGEAMTIRQYFGKIRVKISADHYYRHPRNYTRRAVFSIDEPSPTIRGVNRPVPGGYQGHNGDKSKVEETRPLTTRERALIQTFPKKFQLPDGKSVAEQLLGNAVPVLLAQAVAECIFAYEQISSPAMSRGRKAAQNAIGGINRAMFLRWLVNAREMKEESAKDIWSWLSRAESHIELNREYEDEGEMIYCLERAAKNAPTASKSRMKKALRCFLEFQQRLVDSKSPNLL